MSAEVQHEVDRPADELGRSVVINDPAVVMLHSSSPVVVVGHPAQR